MFFFELVLFFVFFFSVLSRTSAASGFLAKGNKIKTMLSKGRLLSLKPVQNQTRICLLQPGETNDNFENGYLIHNISCSFWVCLQVGAI